MVIKEYGIQNPTMFRISIKFHVFSEEKNQFLMVAANTERDQWNGEELLKIFKIKSLSAL